MKLNGHAGSLSTNKMDDTATKLAEAWLARARCSFCNLDRRLRVLSESECLCRRSESGSPKRPGIDSRSGRRHSPLQSSSRSMAFSKNWIAPRVEGKVQFVLLR
jgi:hypothetical protein